MQPMIAKTLSYRPCIKVSKEKYSEWLTLLQKKQGKRERNEQIIRAKLNCDLPSTVSC